MPGANKRRCVMASQLEAIMLQPHQWHVPPPAHVEHHVAVQLGGALLQALNAALQPLQRCQRGAARKAQQHQLDGILGGGADGVQLGA